MNYWDIVVDFADDLKKSKFGARYLKSWVNALQEYAELGETSDVTSTPES